MAVLKPWCDGFQGRRAYKIRELEGVVVFEVGVDVTVIPPSLTACRENVGVEWSGDPSSWGGSWPSIPTYQFQNLRYKHFDIILRLSPSKELCKSQIVC